MDLAAASVGKWGGLSPFHLNAQLNLRVKVHRLENTHHVLLSGGGIRVAPNAQESTEPAVWGLGLPQWPSSQCWPHPTLYPRAELKGALCGGHRQGTIRWRGRYKHTAEPVHRGPAAVSADPPSRPLHLCLLLFVLYPPVDPLF